MGEVKTSICRYNSAELTAELKIWEDSTEELAFFHPMTGQKCESVEATFGGWSEQEENTDWDKLKKAISEDSILPQKIWHDVQVIDYTPEIDQVLTIREASDLYNVPYNTLLASSLDPKHCRKSGKTWLIEKEWFENIWIPQWKENRKRWKRR